MGYGNVKRYVLSNNGRIEDEPSVETILSGSLSKDSEIQTNKNQNKLNKGK